jgi:hypothetical protein
VVVRRFVPVMVRRLVPVMVRSFVRVVVRRFVPVTVKVLRLNDRRTGVAVVFGKSPGQWSEPWQDQGCDHRPYNPGATAPPRRAAQWNQPLLESWHQEPG